KSRKVWRISELDCIVAAAVEPFGARDRTMNGEDKTGHPRYLRGNGSVSNALGRQTASGESPNPFAGVTDCTVAASKPRRKRKATRLAPSAAFATGFDP